MAEEEGGVAYIWIELILSFWSMDEERLFLVVDGLIIGPPGGGRSMGRVRDQRERG